MKLIAKDTLIGVARLQAETFGTPFGIRDEDLLDSAVGRAANRRIYEPQADICDIAGEYAFGLIKNHAFIDGNKRIAYIACRLCLMLNGADIRAEWQEKYRVIMALADSSLSQRDFADWLKRHTERKI